MDKLDDVQKDKIIDKVLLELENDNKNKQIV